MTSKCVDRVWTPAIGVPLVEGLGTLGGTFIRLEKAEQVSVTNQFFNSQAHEKAGQNDVALVDQHGLGELLLRHPVKMMDLESLLYADWVEDSEAT